MASRETGNYYLMLKADVSVLINIDLETTFSFKVLKCIGPVYFIVDMNLYIFMNFQILCNTLKNTNLIFLVFNINVKIFKTGLGPGLATEKDEISKFYRCNVDSNFPK